MAISNRKKQVLGKVALQIYAPSLAPQHRQLFSAPEWGLMCDPSPLPAGALLHRDVLLNNIHIYLSQHQASCAITGWLVDSN